MSRRRMRRMSDLEIGGVIMSVTSSLASATQQGSQDLGLCFLILITLLVNVLKMDFKDNFIQCM